MRSVVVRFSKVVGPSELPPTLVVKAASAANPEAVEMLLNEWAATQLLTALGDGAALSPRLYAGDVSVPLLVLEDLGDGEKSPSELLEASDPEAATESLLRYIREVARVHLTTRGLEPAFQQAREAVGLRLSPQPLYHDPWSEPCLGRR